MKPPPRKHWHVDLLNLLEGFCTRGKSHPMGGERCLNGLEREKTVASWGTHPCQKSQVTCDVVYDLGFQNHPRKYWSTRVLVPMLNQTWLKLWLNKINWRELKESCFRSLKISCHKTLNLLPSQKQNKKPGPAAYSRGASRKKADKERALPSDSCANLYLTIKQLGNVGKQNINPWTKLEASTLILPQHDQTMSFRLMSLLI